MNKPILTRQLMCVLICAAVTACNSPEQEKATLHRGLGGEPATLDPDAATDSFSYQVIQDIFEGLTAESIRGDAIPAAASSWTVDTAGTTYTFHIRDNAKWSNGKPLLAKHFLQAWQRLLDPKFASGAAENLSLIAGARKVMSGAATPNDLEVRAPDDRTLIVKLERPAPFFPGLLSHSSAFPVYAPNLGTTQDPAKWVSNGPYVLTAWQPGTRIKLRKNPHYWNSANVHVANVEYQFSSDESAQYARYRAGQLDMTDVVPSSALNSIRQTAPDELLVAPYLGTVYYGLNLKSKSLSTSLELRQSLSMAIDRKKLVASLGFGQIPAYAFVPPNIWNYKPQTVAWAELDDQSRITEAKRLYTLAGYSKSNSLHIRVLFNSNSAIKQTAIQIASMWKETLGVEATLEEEEFRVFLESRHDSTRFDIVRLAWVGDFNDAANFLSTFRRSSANNDEGYENSDLETLLNRSEATADSSQRRELLESAERLVINGYPVIPLYYFVSKRLVKPYLLGVVPTPLDRVPSKDISFTSGH